MIRRLLLALGVVAIAAATTSAVAADAPFLWRVQGPKAVHYLMGSVHFLPEDAYPLPAALEAAYAGTSELMLETDPGALETPEVQAKMLEKGLAANGLQGEIPAPLYQKLQKQAEAMQVSGQMCDTFKPWFCALALETLQYQAEGIDPSFGLDLHFYRRALEDNRPIRWFETPEQQIELFGGMSAAMSTQFLASTLDELADTQQEATALVKAWRMDDIATIESMMREMRTQFPETYERLFTIRNRAWIQPLVQTIDGATPTLVVVGAGHLIGSEGVVEMLKTKGYVVTPVQQAASSPPSVGGG